MKRIAIIGGGIVGLATGLKLARANSRCRIVIIEKEPRLGQHQSGHNSGVLHCGLYYKPGSLKATLAVAGIQKMAEFCQRHSIPHEICGKIVVAVSPEEIPRLRDLEARGLANGLQGLQWLEPDQIRAYEPHAAGLAALHVPQEGIIDFPAVVEKMAELILADGHEIVTGAQAVRIDSRQKQIIHTTQGTIEADFLVNCAGLHCDRVFQLAGGAPPCRIVPFRGEYFKLTPSATGLVRNLIYPVPDPTFPFLGVHFTRMIEGGIEAGPNAVLALKREGYRKTDVSARDAWETLTFPGLWKFLARYPRIVTTEMVNSFSRGVFTRSLQRLVPEVRRQDLEFGGAGVRAQAMNWRGDLLMDFEIEQRPGQLHLLNAPSPAATASLAIGEFIAQRVCL